MNIFIIFPCLRTMGGINFGQAHVKNTSENFIKESDLIQQELKRISTFFRQKAGLELDCFSYLTLDISKNNLDEELTLLRDRLEVYRFLTLETDGNRPCYEHTIPYVVIPLDNNPYFFNNGEHVYSYEIYTNFESSSTHANYYTRMNKRIMFNLDIYSTSPSHIEQNVFDDLISNSTESDIRSLSWYNKTFTLHSDPLDNLLKISTAFETLLKPNISTGSDYHMESIKAELSELDPSSKLNTIQEKVIIPHLGGKLTFQLSQSIFEITGSKKIEKWFKEYFYHVGSKIRHGDKVRTRPQLTTSKVDPSVYYGIGATHDFLSNVYFGKKLFKFVYTETHLPAGKYLKHYEVGNLEKKLVSDEQRLKDLENDIFKIKTGKLNLKQLEICHELSGNYIGDKKRVFIILQRILKEVEISFPDVWEKIQEVATLIISADLNSKDFFEHHPFNPYFQAIVEISHNTSFVNNKYNSDEESKLYEIDSFIGFAVNNLA